MTPVSYELWGELGCDLLEMDWPLLTSTRVLAKHYLPHRLEVSGYYHLRTEITSQLERDLDSRALYGVWWVNAQGQRKPSTL